MGSSGNWSYSIICDIISQVMGSSGNWSYSIICDIISQVMGSSGNFDNLAVKIYELLCIFSKGNVQGSNIV